VLPLGAALAIACLVRQVARRPAALYIGAGLVLFCVYVWTYWLTPLTLQYITGTTDYRIIDVIVFVGLVAAAHLPIEVNRRFSGERAAVLNGRPARGRTNR
jgi:hypothetical protein